MQVGRNSLPFLSLSQFRTNLEQRGVLITRLDLDREIIKYFTTTTFGFFAPSMIDRLRSIRNEFNDYGWHGGLLDSFQLEYILEPITYIFYDLYYTTYTYILDFIVVLNKIVLLILKYFASSLNKSIAHFQWL